MPQLTITDLTVDGEVAGFGRFGFLGVELDAATVSVDSGVQIAFTLSDPETQAADGLIRIPELSVEDFTQLISVEVTADEGDYLNDDVVITGNFSVSLLSEGFGGIIGLAPHSAQSHGYARRRRRHRLLPVLRRCRLRHRRRNMDHRRPAFVLGANRGADSTGE